MCETLEGTPTQHTAAQATRVSTPLAANARVQIATLISAEIEVARACQMPKSTPHGTVGVNVCETQHSTIHETVGVDEYESQRSYYEPEQISANELSVQGERVATLTQ